MADLRARAMHFWQTNKDSIHIAQVAFGLLWSLLAIPAWVSPELRTAAAVALFGYFVVMGAWFALRRPSFSVEPKSAWGTQVSDFGRNVYALLPDLKKASRAYPSQATVDSWVNTYSRGVLVLADHRRAPSRMVGYLAMYPIDEATYNGLHDGTMDEAQVTVVAEGASGFGRYWYLADIVVHSGPPGDRKAAVAFRRTSLYRIWVHKLVADGLRAIAQQMPEDGTASIIGIGFGPLGVDLMNDLGFAKCVPSDRHGDPRFARTMLMPRRAVLEVAREQQAVVRRLEAEYRIETRL